MMKELKQEAILALARWLPLIVALTGCVQPGTRIDDGTSCVVAADVNQTDGGYQQITTDGGTVVTKLETPTDLVAVEQNDINAVQLTWVSHSTGDFVSWVEKSWIFSSDSTNKVNSRTEKLSNGDILGSSLKVKDMKELSFRVKDCLKDNSACADYSGAVSTPILPFNLKAATNIVVTEVPSEKGHAYRAIEVSWTDNSYGEIFSEIWICGTSVQCPLLAPGLSTTSSNPYLPPTNTMVHDYLLPNTTIWVVVGVGTGQQFSAYDTIYSPSVKFTTSP